MSYLLPFVSDLKMPMGSSAGVGAGIDLKVATYFNKAYCSVKISFLGARIKAKEFHYKIRFARLYFLSSCPKIKVVSISIYTTL